MQVALKSQMKGDICFFKSAECKFFWGFFFVIKSSKKARQIDIFKLVLGKKKDKIIWDFFFSPS